MEILLQSPNFKVRARDVDALLGSEVESNRMARDVDASLRY